MKYFQSDGCKADFEWKETLLECSDPVDVSDRNVSVLLWLCFSPLPPPGLGTAILCKCQWEDWTSSHQGVPSPGPPPIASVQLSVLLLNLWTSTPYDIGRTLLRALWGCHGDRDPDALHHCGLCYLRLAFGGLDRDRPVLRLFWWTAANNTGEDR